MEHTLDFKRKCIKLEMRCTCFGYCYYPGDSDAYVEKVKERLSSTTYEHKRMIFNYNNVQLREERPDSWILHEFLKIETESGNELSIQVYPTKVVFKIVLKNESYDWKSYIMIMLECFQFDSLSRITEMSYETIMTDSILSEAISDDLILTNIRENIFPAPVVSIEHNAQNKFSDQFFWKDKGVEVDFIREQILAQDYSGNRHGELIILFRINSLLKKKIPFIEDYSVESYMSNIDYLDECQMLLLSRIYK